MVCRIHFCQTTASTTVRHFAIPLWTRRVYGSPQLDALLEDSDERLQELLQELGSAF